MIGTIVQERRLAKGWTVAHLAETSGVGIATVYRLEANGSIQLLDRLEKIAKALGTSAGQLLLDADKRSVSARREATRKKNSRRKVAARK